MRRKYINRITVLLIVLLVCVFGFSEPLYGQVRGGVEDLTTVVIIASSLIIVIFVLIPIIKNAVMDSEGWWVSQNDVEIERESGLLSAKNSPCKAYNKPGSDIVIGELDRYGIYKIVSIAEKDNVKYYKVVETRTLEKEQKSEGLLKIFQGIGFPPAK